MVHTPGISIVPIEYLQKISIPVQQWRTFGAQGQPIFSFPGETNLPHVMTLTTGMSGANGKNTNTLAILCLQFSRRIPDAHAQVPGPPGHIFYPHKLWRPRIRTPAD